MFIVARLPMLGFDPLQLGQRSDMNAIVRAIDVGFGYTKFVTASANGKVDCAHFASLAFFGHTDGGTYIYPEGAFFCNRRW